VYDIYSSLLKKLGFIDPNRKHAIIKEIRDKYATASRHLINRTD
jgi:hypothetical protein